MPRADATRRWRAVLGAALITASAGCTPFEDALVQAQGWDIAVLSAEPFELDAQGRSFASAKPMKALGISQVCVALKARYPMPAPPQMERDVEDLLQGAVLSATLTAANGTTYRQTGAYPAWTREGVISSSEELSACISIIDTTRVPEGTGIASVLIQSDRPLTVLGAYWQSMPRIHGFEPLGKTQ